MSRGLKRPLFLTMAKKNAARVKKVAFLGLFGQQTLGNDCTLQAILEQARERLPSADLSCVCTGPAEIGTRHDIRTFPFYASTDEAGREGKRSLPNALMRIAGRAWRELHHGARGFKFLKGNDMLIVPGTGLLVDHTTGFRGYPFSLFKWSLIARLCRCPLLIVSMGAGPLYHPLSRLFIRSTLSSAVYRSYRDESSKRYVKGIGLKAGGDPVYPDLAFSLVVAGTGPSDAPAGSRPVIGLGVFDYSGPIGGGRNDGQEDYHAYVEKMAAFVEWLLSRGYPLRILMGDLRYDSRVRQDLTERLGNRGLMDRGRQIISEGISSLEDLMSQLERVDIVISPRFHNLILAMMLDKPTIALSHHDKFDALMAALGLSEYCLAIDGLEIKRLTERFVEVEKKAEALRSYLRDKTEEYRRALDRQYDVIFRGSRRNA